MGVGVELYYLLRYNHFLMRKTFTLFLLFLVIISAVLILYFMTGETKSAPSTLAIGDKVGSIQLVSEETLIEEYNLSSYDMAVIFIFSVPCKPCNKNLPYWRRISALKKGTVFGIIVDDIAEMVDFAESMNLSFTLYSPENKEMFDETFKRRSNLAQTLLLHNGEVIYARIGELIPDDYFKIAHKLQIKKGEIK